MVNINLLKNEKTISKTGYLLQEWGGFHDSRRNELLSDFKLNKSYDHILKEVNNPIIDDQALFYI